MSLVIDWLKGTALLVVLAVQAGWQTPPEVEPESSAGTGPGETSTPRPKAAEIAKWTCYIRPSVYRNVVARCGVVMRADCVDRAFERYHGDAEVLALSEASKSESFRERLEVEYREYLERAPENDPDMDSSDRARIEAARERVKSGKPAVEVLDPYCLPAFNRRFQESRQELYLGELALRTALVRDLAGCATVPLSSSEIDRLDNRMAVEASDRGVEHRRFYAEFDPGLIVSFDLYGEIQRAMSSDGPLRGLTHQAFSILDTSEASEPQLSAAVRSALIAFDKDAAAALRAWVFKLTERAATKELNDTTAEQELRGCDQIIGGLIRRRWSVVCDIAEALKKDGNALAAEAWISQAGQSMFPSVYATTRTDKLMSEIQSSGDPSSETATACRERYSAFSKAIADLRARLVAEMVSGAGYYRQRSEASKQQINELRSKAVAMDAACADELTALAQSR